MRPRGSMMKKIGSVFVLLIFALLYVASRTQVVELGYEVSHLRADVAETNRTNRLLRSQIAKAKATSTLANWAKQLHLAPPRGDQVLVLED